MTLNDVQDRFSNEEYGSPMKNMAVRDGDGLKKIGFLTRQACLLEGLGGSKWKTRGFILCFSLSANLPATLADTLASFDYMARDVCHAVITVMLSIFSVTTRVLKTIFLSQGIDFMWAKLEGPNITFWTCLRVYRVFIPILSNKYYTFSYCIILII